MMGSTWGGNTKKCKPDCSQKIPEPCFSHVEDITLNLVITDAAKSKRCSWFFGHVQKLLAFFSAGTQRWSILKKTCEHNCEIMEWHKVESRLQSVHAVRHQASEARDALLEARQTFNDPVAKAEAQTPAEEVGSYCFLICCVIWCEILTMTNKVNKLIQSASVQRDTAVSLISNAKASLIAYTGFSEAQTTAKSICNKMNVEADLKVKRLRNSKRHFSYEASEPVTDALKNLEVNFKI